MIYSIDLRKRVLDFVKAGGSKAAASRTFGISRRCVYNWLNAEAPLKNRDLGDPIALIMTHSSNTSLIFPIAHKWSVLLTSVFPNTVSGMRLTNSTSREKKTLTYKEQCPLKREAYLNALQAAQQCGKTPVFVDESGFTTESTRRYAYAPRGICVEDKVSSNRYRCTSLIAAHIAGCFRVPVLFEGACDGSAFNAWLKQMLCPLLDETYVVILDNASFHKGTETEAIIAACGASLLFLPPYAPELNPIEKDFANIKRIREYNTETSIDEIIKMYK